MTKTELQFLQQLKSGSGFFTQFTGIQVAKFVGFDKQFQIKKHPWFNRHLKLNFY